MRVSKVSAKGVEEREFFVNERIGVVACRRERAVNNEMLLGVKINLFCYNNDTNMYERSITYVNNDDDRMSIRSSDDGNYGTNDAILRRVNDESSAIINSNGK